MVDDRINGTLQTGAVRKTKLPVYRLVGTVFNCADTVWFPTAPTGPGENIALPNYFLKLHTVCATYGRLTADYSICRLSSIKMSTRPSEPRGKVPDV